MINGSQTGKRQSSYRHNIHVNCWYNVSVTLGNQKDVHDDVLSILLLLLRIFLWKPTGISYFCLGIKNILPLLNQNYLRATTCLSRKSLWLYLSCSQGSAVSPPNALIWNVIFSYSFCVFQGSLCHLVQALNLSSWTFITQK